MGTRGCGNGNGSGRKGVGETDRRRLSVLSGLVVCVAVVAFAWAPETALAQSCNAGIGGNVITPPPVYVGEMVQEVLVLGNDISSGPPGVGNMTIDNYSQKLECQSDGILPIILELCVDGNAKDFVQVVSTDCTDAIGGGGNPVAFNCAQAGNDLTCGIAPATVLAPGEECTVTLDFLISAPPANDVTPSRIEQATGFTGECLDNGLDGSARGSVAIDVAICDVQMDRQVSCDGVDFVDVRDVDDPDNANTLSCLAQAPDQVTVRHVISNTGNQPLLDCDLLDGNPLLGASQPIGPIGVGGDVVIDTVGICMDIEDGEPTGVQATVTCECANPGGVDIFAVDSDTAGFECMVVQMPATTPWGSALLAAMLLAALSLWSVWQTRARV